MTKKHEMDTLLDWWDKNTAMDTCINYCVQLLAWWNIKFRVKLANGQTKMWQLWNMSLLSFGSAIKAWRIPSMSNHLFKSPTKNRDQWQGKQMGLHNGRKRVSPFGQLKYCVYFKTTWPLNNLLFQVFKLTTCPALLWPSLDLLKA